MRVLVACEFSGRVRDVFIAKGHDAYSCDLYPSETHGPHYMGNVLDYLHLGWDLLIAHPPCTHLATSGARWFKDKDPIKQANAVEFAKALLEAPIHKIALENPISVLSNLIRKPDQIVQPWWFGHPEKKATCLWLKNLPLLKPTKIVAATNSTIHMMPQSPNRARNRSRTFTGLAKAMAEQWS